MELSIATVLAQLDAWRELPSYRLEPRVDAFVAIFLRGLLETREGALYENVIPELPLRRAMLWDEGVPGRNKSKKVDFALCARDRSVVHLVEFKTDMSSRNDGQDGYLANCGRRKFSEILQGIADIRAATATRYSRKYQTLDVELRRWGFGLSADQIRAGERTLVRVHFLQPCAHPESGAIGFGELARFMEASAGDFGKALAPYFRKWTAGPCEEAN